MCDLIKVVVCVSVSDGIMKLVVKLFSTFNGSMEVWGGPLTDFIEQISI